MSPGDDRAHTSDQSREEIMLKAHRDLALGVTVFLAVGCSDHVAQPNVDGGALDTPRPGSRSTSPRRGPSSSPRPVLFSHTEAGPVDLEAGPGRDGAVKNDGWYSTDLQALHVPGQDPGLRRLPGQRRRRQGRLAGPRVPRPVRQHRGARAAPRGGREIGIDLPRRLLLRRRQRHGTGWLLVGPSVRPARARGRRICPYKPQLVGGKFCPATQAASCMNYLHAAHAQRL